jgi:hypothetical protein
MSSLENAFGFVIPKYRFHTNKSYMVIDNKWQIEDEYEPKLKPCNTLKYPISGNDPNNHGIYNDWSLTQNPSNIRGPPLNSCNPCNPEFGKLAEGVNLPVVPLPYIPPANIGLLRNGTTQTPMYPYEAPVLGPPCNSMSTCNNGRRFRR